MCQSKDFSGYRGFQFQFDSLVLFSPLSACLNSLQWSYVVC
uniref:Uncharacterized protein n=1 Tax=Anguilla anguilla TaxID=7936 RepID=A0A0E9W5B6_ANGAN